MVSVALELVWSAACKKSFNRKLSIAGRHLYNLKTQ